MEPHDKKIESIICKNNSPLKENSFKGELIKNLENLTNYDEIEKYVKSYFTKFKPDDKIKELLKSFYLHPDVVVRVPLTFVLPKHILHFPTFFKLFFIQYANMHFFTLKKKYINIYKKN